MEKVTIRLPAVYLLAQREGKKRGEQFMVRLPIINLNQGEGGKVNVTIKVSYCLAKINLLLVYMLIHVCFLCPHSKPQTDKPVKLR